MAGYYVFDENVAVYEKWRPRYVEDMYSDIDVYKRQDEPFGQYNCYRVNSCIV